MCAIGFVLVLQSFFHADWMKPVLTWRALCLFVLIQDKTWKFVEGLPINDFSREKMDLTAKELAEEKETAVEFLSSAWLSQEEIQNDLRVEESKSRL